MISAREEFDQDPCRIEVRGLRLLAAHGALACEQDLGQPFEVDFDVEFDCRAGAQSDSLADTLDYGDLLRVLSEAFGSGGTKLLETLARRCAVAVLDAALDATAVEVVVRKLRPPLPADVAHVGVRIRLTRRPE